MSLVSQVQGRYSTAALLQLTNPDDPDAVTASATKLAYAAADISAEFEARAGVAYDDTVAVHVAACVEGVIALLTWRVGTKGGEALMEAWRKRVDLTFGRVLGRDAIMPGTNSLLQPTTPGENGVVVRPPFDSASMGGVLLNQPGVPSDDLDVGQ